MHGYPLRAVVPGYIGARSVKWLAQVNVLAEPSRNYFQTSAYKILPSTATPADWHTAPPIGEFPINSAICTPVDGSSIAAGLVRVSGYALAQGAATVAAVELFVDGAPAAVARFLASAEPWTWRQWEAELRLGPGTHEIAVAAADSAGHRQPAEIAPLWNAKGYLNNAWHRIRVHAR